MRLRADGFESARLALVPEAWRGRVAGGYGKRISALDSIAMGTGKRTAAEQAANAWLLGVSGIFEKVRFAPGLTEGDIRDRAAECAKTAINLAEIAPGIFVPDVATLRARLVRYAATFGVIPPALKVKDRPAVARLTCPIWWRRALRVAQTRQIEHGAIALGYVHKRAEMYASDATVARRMEQRRRNADMLANTTALNLDTGDEYNLGELAALSVANPAIRRGELLTRISGFEVIARGVGHIAEFVTLTCPSRFHRMRKAANGYIEQNQKHDGSTPREAQKYLVAVWARIRAKLARIGIKVYGLRIAEPHHDACPHWHMMLFMTPYAGPGRRALPRFRAVFRHHALRDSGDESGAKKYRVKFESIDFARGSAAGYVLKYIAKNIEGNGYQVQGDIEGGSAAIYPGQRVEAWASTWGIRQFQQIGGAPVGVWRELRRMRDEVEGMPKVFESARRAADAGDWAGYTQAMGGATVARDALPLRAAYTKPGERISGQTGEVQTGKQTAYGDEAPGVVYGLRYWEVMDFSEGIAQWKELVERVVVSNRYRWEMKRGNDAGTGAGVFVGGGVGDAGGFVVWDAGNDGAGGLGGLGFGKGEARAARTRVNNCTQGVDVQTGISGAFCLVDFDWLKKYREEMGNDGGRQGKGGGAAGKGGIEPPAYAIGGKKGDSGDGGCGRSAGA